MAPSKLLFSTSLLLVLTATCSQLSPAFAQVSTPIRQIPISSSELAAQTVGRAAYFSSVLAAGGGNGANSAANVRNFAATPIDLGGGYLSLATFLVDVAVGTPPVTVPLVVDTGSHICFTQGPSCTTCPGGTGCQNSPFGGESDCPYGSTIYNPSASSTAVTTSTCAECAADSFGSTGCLGEAYSPANTCQFDIQFGIGNAAGTYAKDVVSVGSISTGNKPIFIGSTVFQASFDGTAGLLGFGPSAPSLPFQLKQVGALSSSTYALCLRSGFDNGGTLFLGGIPDQPGGSPYDITYTGPLFLNPFVFYLIPNPTDVLLNGNAVANAASALQSDTNAGSLWIVDSGTTLTSLSTPLYNTLFNAIKTAVGCPNSFSQDGLDYIDLQTCDPPFTSFSNAELYARFPTLTLKLQGTQAVARPKSYIFPRTTANRAVNPGIFDAGPASGDPNNPEVRIIGDSFMTDNLVVFDAENDRVGFASVDCNTLLPLSPTNTPIPTTPAPTTPEPTTPAPTTPAPTTPAPTTPAPTTPAPTTPGPTTPAPTTPGPTTPAPTTPGPTTPTPTTPAPTTPGPTTPEPTTPAPTTPAPTTPTPTTPAPTTPAPTTPAPTTPAPTTPAPTTPAPTTPAPTTSAPTTPAPTTPTPTTPVPTTPPATTSAPTTPAPTGGSADPGPDGTCYSTPATPNQCFTEDGSQSICCAGQCPTPPAIGTPSCTPTTPAPTTLAPAPTTPAPTTPAPTPTTPTIFPVGGICDAASSLPNQCFSSDGSLYTCCPAGVGCPSPPMVTPACATADVPSPTTTPTNVPTATPGPGGPPLTTCDPQSTLPNQCFNANGSAFICCSGPCPGLPGSTPTCA